MTFSIEGLLASQQVTMRFADARSAVFLTKIRVLEKSLRISRAVRPYVVVRRGRGRVSCNTNGSIEECLQCLHWLRASPDWPGPRSRLAYCMAPRAAAFLPIHHIITLCKLMLMCNELAGGTGETSHLSGWSWFGPSIRAWKRRPNMTPASQLCLRRQPRRPIINDRTESVLSERSRIAMLSVLLATLTRSHQRSTYLFIMSILAC